MLCGVECFAQHHECWQYARDVFCDTVELGSFASLRMTVQKRLPSWTGGVDLDRAKRVSGDGVVESKMAFLHSSRMMEISIFEMLPLWLLEHIQDREISIYFQISKL
jgi:hypothetical protein